VILNTNRHVLTFAQWGMHPKYDKTQKMFFINARNDSMSKPTWKEIFYTQRCLIPADGFYEWQKLDNSKEKLPYRFELKDMALFAFAGLWLEETDKNGVVVPHCVIITTEPNKTVGKIHDRMPAILHKTDEAAWLDSDTPIEVLTAMLQPYQDESLHSYPVSKLVNSPANDSPEIIEPYS
jgi:putative SOS response-associated peptidase YedK